MPFGLFVTATITTTTFCIVNYVLINNVHAIYRDKYTMGTPVRQKDLREVFLEEFVIHRLFGSESLLVIIA